MLNIPETVKALYKRDGVRKNFRAHFPNGELPDITNENIVQESVKFQESVCSHDVFKFGLSEASVIEFETVGVANMYGMKIACYNEIDCSSLTAAEIANIEAGTWDGEFVPLASSDIGYPFFRVPYGVFRVEECPRDHQAMAHRKVTAYTIRLDQKLSPMEQGKQTSLTPQLGAKYTTYRPNTFFFAYQESFWGDRQFLTDTPKTQVKSYSQWLDAPIEVVELFSADQKQIAIDLNYSGRYYYFAGEKNRVDWLPADALYGLTMDSFQPKSAFFGEIRSRLTKAMILEYLRLFESQASEFMTENAPVGYLTLSEPGGQSVKLENPFTYFDFISPPPVFYPLFIGAGDYGFSNLWIPSSVTVTVTATNDATGTTESESVTLNLFSSAPVLYKYNLATPNLYVVFQPTNTERVGRVSYLSFADAYSTIDLVNGALEITAQFASADRFGGMSFIHLSNANAITVLPDEYSQMWFDEYDVEPIGTVRYAYTDDAGEEQVADYKFGSGASIYDMSDNAVFKVMDGANRDVIQSMLATHFIPHLAPVNFLPIDLEMKGLPYIEAGDALAVTAQDGTICRSYVLRRELDGVQVLTDKIDSESGLIIEEGGT